MSEQNYFTKDDLIKSEQNYIELRNNVVKKKYCLNNSSLNLNPKMHEAHLSQMKVDDEKTFLDVKERIIREIKKFLKEHHSFKEILDELNPDKETMANWEFVLLNERFIPGGSILYGLGNTEKVSLSNCYVIPIESDSIDKNKNGRDGIGEAFTKIMRTYSCRGGVGTDITVLRPKGTKTHNAAKTSTGSVSFMPLLSLITNTIGQNNRRGANITSIDIRHPDALDFIESKSNPEKIFGKNPLTGFVPDISGSNISCKLTDDFMYAVMNDEYWTFKFPDYENNFDMYNKHWTGDYEEWKSLGGKFKTYETVRARDVLFKIANSSWECADPGVMFIDAINSDTPIVNIDKTQKVITTNPCFTGDTLVAVADSRNKVSFAELAKEGKDTFVWCKNDKNELVIRHMRNIRKTGINKKIIKLHLTNGEVVKCTPEHKFYIDGIGYVEAKDLKNTDSFFILRNNSEYYLDGNQTNLNKHTYIDNILSKIEFCDEYEDVYNGTVDEFHNYFVGGSIDEYDKEIFISVKNCGEQGLSKYGNCLLGAINLPSYVIDPWDKEKARFNFELFKNDIKINVIIMNIFHEINKHKHPLKQQREMDEYAKRIGVEFTGLADMVAMLGYVYGSEESLELIEEVLAFKAYYELRTSCYLAKQLGCCKSFKSKKARQQYLTTKYFKGLCKQWKSMELDEYELIQNIDEFGLRNSALNTVGPTGTISILADNCTSGIEPLFALSYQRKSMIQKENGTEGDANTYNVIHYPLVKYLKQHPELFTDDKININELKRKFNYIEADELDYKQRIKVQAVVQKYTDQSISSTINLPADCSVEDIKNIYYEAWHKGLKGITVYRATSKDAILTKTTDKKEDVKEDMLIDEAKTDIQNNPSDELIKKIVKGTNNSIWDNLNYLQEVKEQDKIQITLFENDLKDDDIVEISPRKLSQKEIADRIEVAWNGCNMYVVVTRDKDTGKPLEIFVNPPFEIGFVKGIFDPQVYFDKVTSWYTTTRLISVMLRSNIGLKHIIKQLEKVAPINTITHENNVLLRILYMYQNLENDIDLKKLSSEEIKEKNLGSQCPECNEMTLIFQNGCNNCNSCGYSRCS